MGQQLYFSIYWLCSCCLPQSRLAGSVQHSSLRPFQQDGPVRVENTLCSGLTLTETKVRTSFTRVPYINPRPGQYLNACAQPYHQGRGSHEKLFTLIRPHAFKGRFLPRQVKSTPLSASSTQHVWELLEGNYTAVLPRHALGRRISIFADLCTSKSNKTNWPGGGLVYVCQLLLSLSCLSLNVCSNVQEDLLHLVLSLWCPYERGLTVLSLLLLVYTKRKADKMSVNS